ncbi:PQQ-dependent sugar dehydrogenase [Actinomadura barringtoniae]|uniref:PQQ-dependent sugar dehydrogenase n=1 Tax=Actinomadura barringtoniae TaxID=1427535 RepID=A0A939PE14_9ACTN|nr:PQQ-dependent sugar dehydrogenase [Actinomadura barringtoniae]MBO2450598.1 PQQ-dependent sugar dehydrogenase [Actinomadura barringtoniae]
MKLRRTVPTVLIPLLSLTACSSGNATGTASTPPPLPSPSTGSSTPPASSNAVSPGQPRVLATGLSVPWAIAFLPQGDAMVTERNTARLLRVTPQGRVTEVGKIPDVEPAGEGGLLGVTVSPDYPKDHFIYVYYSAAKDNRVVRFTYENGLTNPHPIVTGIPVGSNHNGGRLAFGPDRMLYITTGETYRTQLAQDKNSLGGKILRVTPDGRPAPGNPFGNRVWTWGHRNVQGLAWDDHERLYATEFGQDTYDEINLIQKGHNYGWPKVEGVGSDPKYTNPLLTWSTDEASPSGLAYARGSLWAAALRGKRLWQIPLSDDGKVGRPIPRFEGRYGRLRAAVRAPDGSLWITTSNKDGRGNPQPGDDKILVIPLS